MHIGVGRGGGGGYCLPISITRLLYNTPLLIIISNLPPPSPTQLLASSDTYGSFYVLFIPYVFYTGNEVKKIKINKVRVSVNYILDIYLYYIYFLNISLFTNILCCHLIGDTPCFKIIV